MPEDQDANNNTATRASGGEAGVNSPTAAAGQSLTDANRRMMNYLVHRMLWEQQEKFAADHWGPDGNLRVEDIDD